MTSAQRKEVRTGGALELPPGPRAPALWQTLAWMSRPGAFLQGVHRRFGDPATIRTYWTEEPMVLFSGPDAVREVFALPAAIAPAGQSWEFVRPFAGPHSILVIDGEEHLRERRLLQKPFHGEQMRALAPMIAELARAEFATWRGPVNALSACARSPWRSCSVSSSAPGTSVSSPSCAARSTEPWRESAPCRECWRWPWS